MAAIVPYLPAILGAAGSIGSALLSRGGDQETPTQKLQRELIDELLASLSGEGKYSSLFSADEETFNKRFGDPARRRFETQTAPAIQQQFIASGQQRGSGLEDTLTRAGVDLEEMLNQQYQDYIGQAEGRQLGAIGSILGQGAGAPVQPTTQQTLGQGIAGYLASPSSEKGIESILKGIESRTKRKGFTSDATLESAST